MFIGEQPGNQEDLESRPFVGPAGRLLDTALAEAGVDRKKVYVTNAVKHFKWEPRGKRRIHKKPNSAEIAACRPWLDAEIAALQPKVIVCLGGTAAQALLGSNFRVTQHRGELLESPLAPHVMATVHSSSCAPPTKKPATKKCSASSTTFVKSYVGLDSSISSVRSEISRLILCVPVVDWELPAGIEVAESRRHHKGSSAIHLAGLLRRTR